MTGRVTVALDDVHVTYRVFEDPARGLRQMVTRARGRRRYTHVHAVRGVTMRLREGETVGIIGPNGSGKSTLMAAMTGLLPVESGRVRVVSKPRLLGVGAALRPGVSGRRNVIIGGLALGFTKAEIEQRADEIIAFSGLGEAIDRPMRTYSAGQKARLNFSIATVKAPEILLVDEALAVGDAEFRERSQKRIEEIRAAAGTIVLITHNLPEIRSTCSRVIWLEDGEIRLEGDPAEVVDAYEARALS